MTWDFDEEKESAHFLARPGDIMLDYITGQGSIVGIACFDNYIVDLDNGIPVPFMEKRYGARFDSWRQGRRVNANEDILVSLGTIITPLCYKEIYYQRQKNIKKLHFEKLNYSMEKQTVAFDYLDDYESFEKIMDLFEESPLFFCMLVLENKDGITPLDVAVENNTQKAIEIILKKLMRLPYFSLSKVIYEKFGSLFNLNIKVFEDYLNSCFFQTRQMYKVSKAMLDKGKIIRQAHNC